MVVNGISTRKSILVTQDMVFKAFLCSIYITDTVTPSLFNVTISLSLSNYVIMCKNMTGFGGGGVKNHNPLSQYKNV
jgi:hypothetical protein